MKFKETLMVKAFLISLFTTTIAAQEIASEITLKDSIKVDNQWLTYQYYVPQYLAENARLLVVFHDNEITSATHFRRIKLAYKTIADKTANTVIVYPERIKNAKRHRIKSDSVKTTPLFKKEMDIVNPLVLRMAKRYRTNPENTFGVHYLAKGINSLEFMQNIPDIFKGFVAIGHNINNRNWTLTQSRTLDSILSEIVIQFFYQRQYGNQYQLEEASYADHINR